MSARAAGLAALPLASGAGPAGAQPVDYRLDPSHSFATFELLHFDTATIRGRFGPLDGRVQLDRSARRGRAQVVIVTTQVSTGGAALDSRLHQGDFLAVAAHPQALFLSPSASSSAPTARPAR